jgi:hypothetical protein
MSRVVIRDDWELEWYCRSDGESGKENIEDEL